MATLLIKWIVKATEPLKSNLHMMLRYHLSQFQPYAQRRWQSSLEFFTMKKYKSKEVSKIWNRIEATWKDFPKVSYLLPMCHEKWINCSIWHDQEIINIGPRISEKKASRLHKNSLSYIKTACKTTETYGRMAIF